MIISDALREEMREDIMRCEYISREIIELGYYRKRLLKRDRMRYKLEGKTLIKTMITKYKRITTFNLGHFATTHEKLRIISGSLRVMLATSEREQEQLFNDQEEEVNCPQCQKTDELLSTESTGELEEEANTVSRLQETNAPPVVAGTGKPRVFIVHGHDDAAKLEVARTLEHAGFAPIILSEQASSGRTIIKQIETYTDVCFGVILYTPCDLGRANKEDAQEQPRARQNVVFEHGYLIAKLGEERVCALLKDGVETPGDMDGVVYIPMDEYGGWIKRLALNMKAVGLDFDLNKV